MAHFENILEEFMKGEVFLATYFGISIRTMIKKLPRATTSRKEWRGDYFPISCQL
jgi:hypothetical protein